MNSGSCDSAEGAMFRESNHMKKVQVHSWMAGPHLSMSPAILPEAEGHFLALFGSELELVQEKDS